MSCPVSPHQTDLIERELLVIRANCKGHWEFPPSLLVCWGQIQSCCCGHHHSQVHCRGCSFLLTTFALVWSRDFDPSLAHLGWLRWESLPTHAGEALKRKTAFPCLCLGHTWWCWEGEALSGLCIDAALNREWEVDAWWWAAELFVLTLFLHDRNYESRWFLPFGPSIGRVDGKKAPYKPGKGTRIKLSYLLSWYKPLWGQSSHIARVTCAHCSHSCILYFTFPPFQLLVTVGMWPFESGRAGSLEWLGNGGGQGHEAPGPVVGKRAAAGSISCPSAG